MARRAFGKSSADRKRANNAAFKFLGMPAEFQSEVRDYKPRSESKPKAKGELSELQEQIRVVTWWGKNCDYYGYPPYALFAIPNGASMTSAYGAKNLQLAGMRAGAEDLFLAVPIRASEDLRYSGLFIEMKIDSGKVSVEQSEMHFFHRRVGYRVEIAWSHLEAIELIQDYLVPF